jgi:cellulose synthase/poly-beta-1,6-N-acetylglucosamine synthase-like glycosyltransferase
MLREILLNVAIGAAFIQIVWLPFHFRRLQAGSTNQNTENNIHTRRPDNLKTSSNTWSVRLTQVGLLISVGAWLALGGMLLQVTIEHVSRNELVLALSYGLLFLIASFLIYGNVVYLVTRIGYLKRVQSFEFTDHEAVLDAYENEMPTLTVLVPSYKEEISVIRNTLLSAALQDYPNRRVVLLVDDPPQPRAAKDRAALDAARAVTIELQALFDQQVDNMALALQTFQLRTRQDVDLREERQILSKKYDEMADWLESIGHSISLASHADRFFKESIIDPFAASHRGRALALQSDDASLTQLEREYKRLAQFFRIEITSFERKQYENLSHAPNKAMNLNSYLALIGKTWQRVQRSDGTYLLPAPDEIDGWYVPASDYMITLDADSVILPTYASQLISFIEQPQNARIAVVQTPYSAFPQAPTTIERIAGATTDIQYIIHQGFTQHGATYWVGANALLRQTALEEIATTTTERGHMIKKYIHDRTVIEDTESSVDLLKRGWQLFNYPRRLAYSATPPDFGALLIQRRRWSNGGLIILPKLLSYLFGPVNRGQKGTEGFLRVHYLASITGVNIGILLLMLLPFQDGLYILALVVASLPYFVAYASDLVKAGYRRSDLLRVYALNLLLIPVHIAGVVKSIQQIITGKQTPFKRTPKVGGRTSASALYVLVEWGLVVLCVSALVRDVSAADWSHALFNLVNVAGFVYAAVMLIGIRASFEDVSQPIHKRFARTVGTAYAPTQQLETGSSLVQSNLYQVLEQPSPQKAKVEL